MALRLTGTSLPAAAPSAPELSARASSLLSAGDIDGYRKLFGSTTEHTDLSRRYQARVALLEQGLHAAGQAPAARSADIFIAVARAALDLLEEDACEPLILNYAGVSLYELWSLDAARDLFQAALRLDPTLPHIKRNLEEIVRRRRAVSRGARQPVAKRSVLPALAQRAKRVARRAQPATGLTLSLCMIVRDEEEMLPRCLAAVAPAVDEIIVVDTGSQDRTIEIAESFGARVIEFEWTGSFSDARNVSFDAATGDWIMYLDADEVLITEDIDKLRALTGRTWREAFYLFETNFTGEADDGSAVTFSPLRVFRNRPAYRFKGRLHEQIAQNLPSYLPERLEYTSVRVEHYGYLGAVRDAKEKSKRNIELLLEQRKEAAPTPFMHFNLGSEYAAAGDAPAAKREFEASWAMLENEADLTDYGFAPSLVVRLCKSLRMCGQAPEALAQATAGLRHFEGFTDLVFEQAWAALAMGDIEAATGYFERCIEMGDAPNRYTATVGCGTHLPRIALAELHLERGELEPARELLAQCLTARAGFLGAVLPYATTLRRAGMDPDAVAADVEARIAEMTPTVRFMLATALYETGASEAAELQYREVLERQPRSGRARVALGETLLSLRRYREAADEAAVLDETDPLAPNACRTELFGRILAGDLEGARSGLARAQHAGLPTTERALFADWSALASGEVVTRGAVGDGLTLLVTILEALLRVQEFKAFEILLPLLLNSLLPRREQREVLAAMYLRRGFLASAAKEWMDVCAEQPDGRALVGLARVALAHGLPEDAVVFATEALALEPANADAHAILLTGRRAAAA